MSIKVFYCYAHEDKALRAVLEKHLGNLKRQELITGWSDRNIDAGKIWAKEIDGNLKTANIILLLISPDFMASDYCYSIELMHALERQENGTARVIPIMLRHVECEGAPFSHLQALPTDAIPVTDRKWRNRDVAFVDVAKGIRKIVKELLSQQLLDEGNIHFYRERYENALEAFERAIFLDPTNALAHVGIGQTLLRLASNAGDLFFDIDDFYQKALEAFEKAISLDNTNIDAFVGKGKALLALVPWTNVENILNTCEQAILLDAKNAEAYAVQGDAFIYLNMYAEAVTSFEKAIEFGEFFNKYAYNSKGDVLYKLERYEDALTAYNMVIQEFPKNAYAYKGKGDALYKLERYDEALAAYNQTLSLNYSSPALIHIQKGNVLYESKLYQEALAAYEDAIKGGQCLSNTERAEAYRGKANVLQYFAQQAFKTADELDPDKTANRLELEPFLPDYPDDIS